MNEEQRTMKDNARLSKAQKIARAETCLCSKLLRTEKLLTVGKLSIPKIDPGERTEKLLRTNNTQERIRTNYWMRKQ